MDEGLEETEQAYQNEYEQMSITEIRHDLRERDIYNDIRRWYNDYYSENGLVS